MSRGWRRSRLLLIILVCGVGAFVCRSWIAEIPNALAVRAMKDRTPENAFAYLDWSESIAGATAKSEFLRARASRKLSRWDDAKRHLEKAEALGGDKTLLQREDWLTKAQSGRLGLVHSRRNQMLLDPRDDTEEICEAFVLGYLSIRHFDEALRLIESWSADYPENPEPHHLKGLLHAEANKFALAEAAFRKAIEICPTHFAARLALANALLTEHKEKEALEHYQQCDKQKKDPGVALGIAKCLLILGELKQASTVLEAGVAKHPNDFKLRLELGRFLMNEDVEKALTHLEQAQKLERKSPAAQYLLSQALARLGRREEAAPYLAFVSAANEQLAQMTKELEKVGENSKDIESRLKVGLIQMEYGSDSEALYWFQSVIDLDAHNVVANNALADFYEKKSADSPHFKELAAYFRKAAETEAKP